MQLFYSACPITVMLVQVIIVFHLSYYVASSLVFLLLYVRNSHIVLNTVDRAGFSKLERSLRPLICLLILFRKALESLQCLARPYGI